MKFLLVALFCVGAVVAQTPAPNAQANAGRELVESLEKRASALSDRVKQVIQEQRAGGFGGLTLTLERQGVLIEALVIDLKAQTADLSKVTSFHHIHVIEEDLLFLENRVSEEIVAITQARNSQPTAVASAQLIVRAEQLIKDAKDTLAKFPTAPEVREINSEIIVVEALVKTIQGKVTPAPGELAQDERELAKQEATLKQLIDKAQARKP